MSKKHVAVTAAAVSVLAGAMAAGNTAGALTAAPGTQPTAAAQPGAAPAKKGSSTDSGSEPESISAARKRLNRARAALAGAQKQADALRAESGQASSAEQIAHRDLGIIARDAYAGGPSDLIDLAALITADDPVNALRDATLASQVADSQSDEWQAAADVLTRLTERLDRADADVQAAEAELRDAQEAVIKAQGSAGRGGPGAARLTQRCQQAKSLSPICIAPAWTEQHLLLDSVLIGRYVSAAWPAVREVGGWRPSDPYPDHPSGRALDIMMPNGGRGSDVALGNEIAAYFQKRAKEYGVYYMIWRQRMWTSGSKPGSWSGMSDRGSPTANHMDHVHISVKDGGSATILGALLKAKQLGG
jgi:hypothetical protein